MFVSIWGLGIKLMLGFKNSLLCFLPWNGKCQSLKFSVRLSAPYLPLILNDWPVSEGLNMIRTILHGKFQHDCIPGTKQVWMELGQSCLKLLQGPLWPLHVHLWMLEAQLEATCKIHSIAVSWETESQHWGQQDGKLTYKQLLVKHSKEIPRIKNNKSRIKINKHGFMKLDSPKFLLYTDYKWSPDLIAWWLYAIVRLGTDGAGT